jgi:hypothetical protein
MHSWETFLEALRALRDHGQAAKHGWVLLGMLRSTIPLPLPDTSVDAVFAQMLLCMALSASEIDTLVGEVRRVLRPGGGFV